MTPDRHLPGPVLATRPARRLHIVNEQKPPDDMAELRALLLEVADSLDAIVVALQTELPNQSGGLGVREAVWRVVRLRRHLGRLGYLGRD